MVGQKFGKSDRDVKAKGSKEKTDRPMRGGPGSDPHLSAMVGSVTNASSPSATKPGAKKGGKPFPFAKAKSR
jgi:hypothetical protein